LFCGVLLGCAGTAAGEGKRDEAPVVVELFTSQGCSSCPPAEAVVNKLARDGKRGDRAVAPLSFHVDYWDDLGWADPYASAAWTARQQEYASALGDRVYTPELIVAGGAGVVGSQVTSVARAIANAPPQRRIVAKAVWGAGELVVEATAPSNASVYVAVYEDGTSNAVPRGENSGETLANDRVVRRLELVAGPGKTASHRVKLDGTWRRVGALAFAQRADRVIVGSALLPRP
jgi:hypothetical protein